MIGKNEVYQFKITLKDSSPTIWRRFQVDSNISLYKMHEIIQIIMGWTESHLHQFIDKDTFYGNSEDDDWGDTEILDENKFKINQVMNKPKAKIIYEYDFGDSWDHALILEKILTKDENLNYPICLDGAMACPPEDCGGLGGYYNLLDIIKNPEHEEHEEMMEWLSEEFNPEEFDLESINKILKRIK